MTRIGLIGSGGMARVYAERIAQIDGSSVTAVASPNTASAFVAEHASSAEAYGSAAALCAEAAVDAVAVLTPTHTHREMVETAAKHDLDTICEKPLARTLDEATAIADAVASSGITFMTAHAIRFFPAYAEARDRVLAGEVGDPGVVRTRRAFGFDGPRGWFGDFSKSGGVLLDLAVHDFDYLRWTFGEVEHVFTRHVGWDHEATSEVSLSLVRFETDVVAHVEAWSVEIPSVPFTTAFEIAGDEGLIEFDRDEVQPIRTFGGGPVSTSTENVHFPRDPVAHELPLRKDGYYRQLEHFVGCAEADTDTAIPVEEGIESMRVALAAVESAERGMPVAPEEVTA